MKKWMFLWLFSFLVFSSVAQTKFEKEERIKEADVPKPALDFMNSLHFDSKIKWYKETGLDTITVEAKTRFEGKKYSIEFKTDGSLEDVEVKIKWRDVPEETQKKIKSFLASRYAKYSVEKIQIQFVGIEKSIRSVLIDSASADTIVTNYEFVIASKVEGAYQKFEYLFSEKGDFRSFALIVQENTDHIEY